jgi:hypothetical protein
MWHKNTAITPPLHTHELCYAICPNNNSGFGKYWQNLNIRYVRTVISLYGFEKYLQNSTIRYTTPVSQTFGLKRTHINLPLDMLQLFLEFVH